MGGPEALWGRLPLGVGGRGTPQETIREEEMITRNAPLFFGLILGIALGLVYGWFIRPTEYTSSSPDALREDYVVDYVLMAAQATADEQDLGQAKQWLSFLGSLETEDYVQSALAYATEHDFDPTDIALLRELADKFERKFPDTQVSPP